LKRAYLRMRRWSWEVESGWRLGIHSGTRKGVQGALASLREALRAGVAGVQGVQGEQPGVRRVGLVGTRSLAKGPSFKK
jgi:hypothetical protein